MSEIHKIEIGALLNRWSYRTDDFEMSCGICFKDIYPGEKVSYLCDADNYKRRYLTIWMCRHCYDFVSGDVCDPKERHTFNFPRRWIFVVDKAREKYEKINNALLT